VEAYTYSESYKEWEWFYYRGYWFHEIDRQVYAGNGCIFAVGHVRDHPNDTHYLLMEKDGQDATLLLFRSDELAAIAWLCSGALWSKLEGEHRGKES
jgi:hypothetical protein